MPTIQVRHRIVAAGSFAVLLAALAGCAPTRQTVRLKTDMPARAAAEEIFKIVAGGVTDPSLVTASAFSEDHYLVGTSWQVVGRESNDVLVAKLLITVEGNSVRIAREQRRCSSAELDCQLPLMNGAMGRVHTSSLPPARDPQIFDEKVLASRMEAAVSTPRASATTE